MESFKMHCPKCSSTNLWGEPPRYVSDEHILHCYVCGMALYGKKSIEQEYNRQARAYVAKKGRQQPRNMNLPDTRQSVREKKLAEEQARRYAEEQDRRKAVLKARQWAEQARKRAEEQARKEAAQQAEQARRKAILEARQQAEQARLQLRKESQRQITLAKSGDWRGKVLVICETCGTSVQKKKWDITKNKSGLFFCSYSCNHSYLNKHGLRFKKIKQGNVSR